MPQCPAEKDAHAVYFLNFLHLRDFDICPFQLKYTPYGLRLDVFRTLKAYSIIELQQCEGSHNIPLIIENNALYILVRAML